MTPCRLTGGHWRFEGTYCVRSRGRSLARLHVVITQWIYAADGFSSCLLRNLRLNIVALRTVQVLHRTEGGGKGNYIIKQKYEEEIKIQMHGAGRYGCIDVVL
jgi:hypothetical protein